jgi:hypothetical protein
MGGGSYDGDVAERTRSTSESILTARARRAAGPERRECHAVLNPKGKNRECADSVEHPNTTPIVVAMDVTRSRGEDIAVIYGKLPMFIGQIIMKNYVPDPVLSFAAVGDASSGDKAPIQIGQFESDNRLDEILSKIWLEMGGGGTGQESYELTAYYYAKHSVLDCNKRGKKGYFFFIGDEGFYPVIAKDQAKVWLGDQLQDDLPAADAFRQLQQKYQVFFIYPQKTWEQRKEDIDAEIQQRVTEAGGMYAGVDIRASLLWNNRNDLDLRVIPPSREEIYYGHKQSNCGGWLDVDMNVQGETTKPVENTRWPKGKAPKGHYKVYVQNYRFHENSETATKFRVEIEINGKIQHFEGQTPQGIDGPQSNTTVFEFNYNPAERPADTAEYAGYHDDVIKTQWASVIPQENILLIEDPHAIIDVMLGALALTEGTVDLDKYLIDMGGRGQTTKRLTETAEALKKLAGTKALTKIDPKDLPDKGEGKERKGRSKRL